MPKMRHQAQGAQMTEARVKELKRPCISDSSNGYEEHCNHMENYADDLEAAIRQLEKDRDAQAAMCQQLRTALESISNPDTFDNCKWNGMWWKFYDVAAEALKTDPTAAEIAFRERCWFDAITEAVLADWHNWNGMTPDQIIKSVMESLRAKEGK